MPLEINMRVVESIAGERMHKNDGHLERVFVFKTLVFSRGPCQFCAVFKVCKYPNNSHEIDILWLWGVGGVLVI